MTTTFRPTYGARGVSPALRALLTVGALALVAGWSASAEAKKAKPKIKMDPNVESTPEPTGPVPPEADANGHVNFGNPQAEGIGRVSVKSDSGDKIQVYLDGRYFGDTPVTIYSVPKGDYIVEAVYPSGKQISKPVSVGENEETAVDLGGAAAMAAANGPGMFDAEMTPGRMTITKVALVVAAVGVVAAVTFGILELKTESDYEKAVGQAQKDSLETKGNHYALATNITLYALTH